MPSGAMDWLRTSTRVNRIPRLMKRHLLLVALLNFCFIGNTFAQEGGNGPFSLFITYQCSPDKRTAFREHVENELVERFEGWKQQGVFRDYLILFASFVNAGEYAADMVVRLDFAQFVDVARWREIERVTPAGLSARAFKLCTPVSTDLADLTTSGGPPSSAARPGSIFLWIPYHLERGVGKPEYKKYFDGYVKPQTNGWLADGALAWWGMYLNQHNTGKPWDVILLLEYTDIQGLARRDIVKQEVRVKLRNDPAWKALNDSKQEVRQEDRVTIMDSIHPRRSRKAAAK